MNVDMRSEVYIHPTDVNQRSEENLEKETKLKDRCDLIEAGMKQRSAFNPRNIR